MDNSEITDKELLDTLDSLAKLTRPKFGKGWLCRLSSTEGGLRIHQSRKDNASPTIREAIKDFLKREV